jgi:hypothetical protein
MSYILFADYQGVIGVYEHRHILHSVAEILHLNRYHCIPKHKHINALLFDCNNIFFGSYYSVIHAWRQATRLHLINYRIYDLRTYQFISDLSLYVPSMERTNWIKEGF